MPGRRVECRRVSVFILPTEIFQQTKSQKIDSSPKGNPSVLALFERAPFSSEELTGGKVRLRSRVVAFTMPDFTAWPWSTKSSTNISSSWWRVSDVPRRRAGGLFVCVDKDGWREYEECDEE